MKINNYKEYLEYIRNWDNLTQVEQELLRKWYREYYHKNKEKERKRYREYYSLNADLEKERVKRIRLSKEDSMKWFIGTIKNPVWKGMPIIFITTKV